MQYNIKSSKYILIKLSLQWVGMMGINWLMKIISYRGFEDQSFGHP